MFSFKRIPNEYTDQRLAQAGFEVVYYHEINWTEDGPSMDGRPLTGPWYFRAVGTEARIVEDLVNYAEDNGIWYILDRPRTKWEHYQTLGDAGISQPYTTMHESISNALMSPIYFPFVIKANRGGRRGHYTFLVREPGDRDRVIEELGNREKYRGRGTEWLVQEYIPNRGDYRAIVVGHECVAMVKRRTKDNINLVMNTSDGNSKRFKNNNWPSSVARLAESATRVLGITVAGVDLVRDNRTGEPVVIEVNEAPGFEVVERRTGIDVAGAIARYLEGMEYGDN